MPAHRTPILPWLVLLVNGCAAPTVFRASESAMRTHVNAPLGSLASPDQRIQVRGLRPLVAGPLHLDEREPAIETMSLQAGETVLDRAMAAVVDAELSEEPSETMEAALDRAREEGRNPLQNGLGALTMTDITGDAFSLAACQPLELSEVVEHDGERWEIELIAQLYSLFVGDPVAQELPLDAACEDAVAEYGGDIDAAEGHGCDDLDIQQYFQEGSACRACVEANGGDFDACVDSGDCAERSPYVVATEGLAGSEYWNVAAITMLACKPDYTTNALVVTHIAEDGSFPEAFDHDEWEAFCVPYWNEDIGGVDVFCAGTDGVFGQGTWPGILGMHPKEGGEDQHLWRAAYTPRIELDTGDTIRWAWKYIDNDGIMSHPTQYPDTNDDGVVDTNDFYTGFGSPYGWGLQPYDLRPDGSDPDVVDDTYARDWIAAFAVKTATTRTGIPINIATHNRCSAWEGPFDDGTWRCTQLTAPEEGYLNDVSATWGNLYQVFSYPTATIASTGLADPDIPGGIVPLLAGSDRLALPDFDGCETAVTFTPDQAPFTENAPDWTTPGAIQGDTWRFEDRDLDLRAVLSTNVTRDWCDGEER